MKRLLKKIYISKAENLRYTNELDTKKNKLIDVLAVDEQVK